ncbi:MAG: N-acetylmuramic acid 6-phosphate etherase [Clostridia bacterium]|nr:N-acetylmuramic acid 6-phosphate etherase [Clostridia bacterium]
MNTESVNKATQNISSASTEEMLTMINNEDKTVAEAVEKAIPQISKLVDKAYEVLSGGGRVFYCGAGTSGRLAVADAAELPPTYGLDPQKIVAIIAGGIGAMVNASEGCEDSRERALATFEEYGIKKGDMVIGISASGQAPFVITIMEEARKLGCPVGCITNNQDTLMEKCADITVAALTGAEAIKGSTRMKAGSAQKMILNMFSTAVCIKLGFVYKNYMVNMVTSNRKLRKRAVTMVCEISGISENEAQDLLEKNNWSVYETLKELEK